MKPSTTAAWTARIIEEQSSTSEELNKSMVDVNRISRENTDAMNSSAQAMSDPAKQCG
ncbi:hypothetical protein [Desulfonatronospira thiodismutans]|uniref:hypothetical protein n=1 Tax=Desulfonatronospira thiodismutans TaxID=488939 RepID=UPI0012946E59|nr:hypothetical protein [Desulfonatronospira thiodismutans]